MDFTVVGGGGGWVGWGWGLDNHTLPGNEEVEP